MTYRPTLSDVAKMAGVSVATASRALSNPDLVAESTRTAVRDAANSCGYQINLVARSLRKQRTNSILVLIPEIDNQFYPTIIKGLEQRAHNLGYSMILGLTSNNLLRENSYLEIVNSRRADGMIVLDGGLDNLIERGIKFNVPTVQVLECLGGESLPTVRIDDRQVAALVVEHLVGLGHRRIAHISGSSNSLVATERIAGFQHAMAAAGCHVHSELIVNGGYTHDGGATAMLRLLDMNEPPTAVFCANDASAMGAIRACRTRGLRVPQDISIVGVDDIDEAATNDPPLTTIHQPRYEIGVMAMDLLAGLIETSNWKQKPVLVPINLIERGSTAPPRH